ncbi:hypothetical protein JCM10207_008608 [Rhodosporidiobolus poonsookiae]
MLAHFILWGNGSQTHLHRLGQRYGSQVKAWAHSEPVRALGQAHGGKKFAMHSGNFDLEVQQQRALLRWVKVRRLGVKIPMPVTATKEDVSKGGDTRAAVKHAEETEKLLTGERLFRIVNTGDKASSGAAEIRLFGLYHITSSLSTFAKGSPPPLFQQLGLLFVLLYLLLLVFFTLGAPLSVVIVITNTNNGWSGLTSSFWEARHVAAIAAHHLDPSRPLPASVLPLIHPGVRKYTRIKGFTPGELKGGREPAGKDSSCSRMKTAGLLPSVDREKLLHMIELQGTELLKSAMGKKKTLLDNPLTDLLANPLADPLADPLANPLADPLADLPNDLPDDLPSAPKKCKTTSVSTSASASTSATFLSSTASSRSSTSASASTSAARPVALPISTASAAWTGLSGSRATTGKGKGKDKRKPRLTPSFASPTSFASPASFASPGGAAGTPLHSLLADGSVLSGGMGAPVSAPPRAAERLWRSTGAAAVGSSDADSDEHGADAAIVLSSDAPDAVIVLSSDAPDGSDGGECSGTYLRPRPRSLPVPDYTALREARQALADSRSAAPLRETRRRVVESDDED